MKTMMAALLLTIPVMASAQTTETAPRNGGGLLGQAGSLLGGGGLAGLAPDIGSIGAGNAAGLLGYCVKNRLLGVVGSAGGAGGATNGTNSGAAGILGRLTGRSGVTSSPGYAAGQSGQLLGGNGQALSLEGLRGQLKTQLCNLVLKRAQSLL